MTHDSSSTRICGAIQIVIIYLFVLKMNCFFLAVSIWFVAAWIGVPKKSPRREQYGLENQSTQTFNNFHQMWYEIKNTAFSLLYQW